MKNITEIEITNVRGIANFKLKSHLFPYQPNFFVAPNGFGKSSLATAFSSLNRDRINLHKNHYHKSDSTNLPEIKITIKNDDNTTTVLVANNTNNDISRKFDINVIKSLLKPKANYRKIKGNPITSPSINVENIYIIENIPNKIELPYQLKKFKELVNDNRQIWPDINDLLKNAGFIEKLHRLEILNRFEMKTQIKYVDNFILKIKEIEGKNDEIISVIASSDLEIYNSEYFLKLVELIEKFKVKSKGEIYLTAIQIIKIYLSNIENFRSLINYKVYCNQKERILELFDAFKSTWKTIVPKEIPIYQTIKKKKTLIHKNFGIEFPKAFEISNGERDVISFIGSLFKVQANFKGKPTILIIDEVFDYLDDANLLAVQFYITKFINFFNEKEVLFFPIILTHLNPHYFKNYFFSNQKIHYLHKWKGNVDRDIENIVISRNNSRINDFKDKISGHFLHYSDIDIEIIQEVTDEFTVQKLGIPNTIYCNSIEFKNKTLEYFDNYVSGKRNYDPISVCIATRILVEKDIYSKLPANLQPEFLTTRTTVAKLNFAKENSDVLIPEIYFFLGTLYNELLHVRKNNDNSSPIYLKLDNKTLKQMIGTLEQ